jgi:phospholipid/cholesterol/gamma-HCH transport system substrate-binding protein
VNRLKTVVLALLAALTLSSCEFSVYDLPLPGGADVGDDPIEVTVEFTDVLDLVPQSTVKVNDVSVGMVREVRLDGYTAEVDLELRNSIDLPANALAEIRQTSLLGEKFVELRAPEQAASAETLEDGAVIPLERSGRNPEVEEVLGALSLVLNGGGVAQLKTINVELANALEGREGSVRSVLGQLETFTGQLDDRKGEIVRAIESLDALARSIQAEQGTIDAALDELPSAIASIDSQREDLVTMLRSLNQLSDVGVRVIRASKEATIASLESLDPVLTQLANAGDDFAKAFQVFLTYPFVDEVVGRDPQVARNLHMGDYTNLAIQMDLDLADLIDNPPGVPNECVRLEELPQELRDGSPIDLEDLCEGALEEVSDCLKSKDLATCLGGVPETVVDGLCQLAPQLPGCATGGGGGGGDGGGPLPEVPGLPGLGGPLGGSSGAANGGGGASDSGDGLLGLFRAPFTAGTATAPPSSDGPPTGLGQYHPALVRLLVPGMVTP